MKIKIDSCYYRTFFCGLPLHISCINSKLGLKKCVLEDVKCTELIKERATVLLGFCGGDDEHFRRDG